MLSQILEKDGRINITTKADGGKKFYFGASWDTTKGETDLDLCVVYLKGGKATDVIYYGKKTGPGVQLSEDNRTGAGDGDDEWAKIDVSALPADCDGLAIGVIVYAGTDFATVANPLIRGCAGSDEKAPEIFRFPIKDTAFDGDTVLVAARLKKGGNDQWLLEAIGKFYAKGKGAGALKALTELDFTA